MVDRSLTNLRFALSKINDVKSLEDAQKLSAMLDYTLFTEMASSELQTSSLSRIELAKNILSEHKGISQLEDVKFALKEVIEQKEKKRPVVLAALDKISQIFGATATKLPRVKLERQAKYFKDKLSIVKDKSEIQKVYYELGNIYTQLSEFIKAKEAYNKVIELNPGSKLAQRAQFNLAWNEKLRGNLDEAIKEFEAISVTYAQEEIGVYSLYQIADAWREKGDYEKAIAIYEQVTQKQPQTDLAQMALFKTGYTQLSDLKDYQKAGEIFEKSKKLFAGTGISTHIEKALLPGIVAQYRKKGFQLLSEGYSLNLAEEYKEAGKYFDKALEIDPEDGVSYIGKALSFLWLKDHARVLEFARKAVKFTPYSEIASVNVGYIYLQLNLVDEAIREYKRFIAFNPYTARVYYNLGYAYALKGRLKEAAWAFQEAVKINPKFTFALNNLGWCLWQLGSYAEAIEMLERAAVIDKQSVDVLFNLGLVYAATGRYEDAQRKFEQILEVDSEYPDMQTQLEKIKKFVQEKEQKRKEEER